MAVSQQQLQDAYNSYLSSRAGFSPGQVNPYLTDYESLLGQYNMSGGGGSSTPTSIPRSPTSTASTPMSPTSTATVPLGGSLNMTPTIGTGQGYAPPATGVPGSSAGQVGGTTGTGSSNSSFPFVAAPALISPMGPGPGGASTMGTNYNPATGVTAGQFSATAAPYQYGGKPQSDVNAQAQMNLLGQGNPFQSVAQQYANTAGYNSANQGGAAINAANTMYGGSNAILNTAFDPQNALYNQMLQKTRDQANASEAQRGLSASPYGANISNQAVNDFNIGWQNQQLQRQAQGLQAAGQSNTTGANLGSTGVAQINNAGQLPYATGQNALSNEQQSVQDWLNYLAGGTNASAGNVWQAPVTPTITTNPYNGSMTLTN